MKLLAIVLAALFAAVLITLYAIENPGYVLIAHTPWSVEMPLTLFVPLLLLTFLALYAVFYLFVRLVRIPRDVARWRLQRHARAARRALTQGLTRLAEGHWAEAETELLAGLRHGDAPLLNHLAAAYASQEQDNLEKRDEYLAAAQKSAPSQTLAIGVTQAYLQWQAGQIEQALATLTDLRQRSPRHRYVLKLLAQAYKGLRDWASLAELIPELRQNNVLNAREIEALELQAHRELLTLTLPQGSIEVLRHAWNAVPKNLRRQRALIAVYARQLIQQNEMAEAEALLRTTIEQEWDDALVELYGRAHGNAPEQLGVAEGWAAAHAEDPWLLLTLGRLAVAADETAKARGYLEKCVGLHGPAEAARELGALLERLGDKDKALSYYRRAFELYVEERRGTPARPGLLAATRLRSVR